MGSTSTVVVGIAGALVVIAAVVCIFRGRRGPGSGYERGGRGFKGEFQADDDLFLSSDPTTGLMGDEYTASPLMDPRLDSFSGGDSFTGGLV